MYYGDRAKEIDDHVSSNPKGDPRNVHRGSIKDAREAKKKYKEEHGDEELGLDCCICGDILYKAHHQSIPREHLPDTADIGEHDRGFVCADEEGSCLGKLRKGEI